LVVREEFAIYWPHRFAHFEVDVRLASRTVEIFYKGERIAVHQRMSGTHEHTIPDHKAFQSPQRCRFREDAAMIRPATAALCELHRPHPSGWKSACTESVVRFAGDAMEKAAAEWGATSEPLCFWALLLCLLAVRGGAETFVDIAWKKIGLLRRFRPFRDGIPAHDHLGDIFGTLDAEEFQRSSWRGSGPHRNQNEDVLRSRHQSPVGWNPEPPKSGARSLARAVGT
jgi:hypothetical protein